MAEPVTTDIENRLNAIMAAHGHPDRARELQADLQQTVYAMQTAGISLELIAYSIAQHASAAVAAMKMARLIDPVLADLLAQDFTDTVHRAFPGAAQLGNKQ